jgi:hypothetical protein
MGKAHKVAVLALVGSLGHVGLAAAQTDRAAPQLPRVDASLSVGWSGTNQRLAITADNWYHTRNGALSLGYYWTEHLKTEVDASLTSEGQLWGRRFVAEGTYAYVTHRFSTRDVTLAQQYQFGHNARFHPFVGAGVAFEWVRHIEEHQPLYQILRTAPYSVLIEPARTIGPTTELQAVPFVSTGFKGYFNERGFFRSDLYVGFRGGVRYVTLRSGFGFDF